MPPQITLYGKPDCRPCAEAKILLAGLAAELGLHVAFVDITADAAAWQRFHPLIPAAEIAGGAILPWPFDASDLLHAVAHALAEAQP